MGCDQLFVQAKGSSAVALISTTAEIHWYVTNQNSTLTTPYRLPMNSSGKVRWLTFPTAFLTVTPSCRTT